MPTEQTERASAVRRRAHVSLRISVAAYVCLLGLLALLYLNVPPDMPEQWAGKEILPRQSVRVSALYRDALGLPLVELPQLVYRGLHAVLLAGVWAPYALAAGAMARRPSRRLLWGVSALAVVLALLMPPLLSTDVFYYAITGETAALQGANPHVSPPGAFPESPLLPLNYWRDFPSPYGPIWTTVSAALVGLAGNTPLAASLAFKLLGAVSHMLTAILVYRSVRILAPGHEVQAAALWAWNPLALLEGAMNGHNDALLAVLLTGSLTLATERRGVAAYVLASCAALVKLTALPVVGLLALGRLNAGTIGRRLRLAFVFAAILSGLAVVAYAPYWAGGRALEGVLGQSGGSVQGFVAGAAELAGVFLPHERAGEIGRAASTVALVALGVWVFWMAARLWRAGERLEPGGEGLLWGAVLVLLPAAFVRSYPWYVLPGLAVLAAVWPRERRVIVGLYTLAGVWLVVQYGV